MSDFLPEDPDRDLLLAVREGDGDAFEALVRRYQGRVVGFVRTLTGRAEDAEDLAQEVFVRVYRSIARFRGDSLFRTWLYRVAVNVAHTHRARRVREAAVWQAEVFEKAQPGFDGFRDKSRAEFATLMQQLNAEIELVLTDAQRARLLELAKQPPPRGGPPPMSCLHWPTTHPSDGRGPAAPVRPVTRRPGDTGRVTA